MARRHDLAGRLGAATAVALVAAVWAPGGPPSVLGSTKPPTDASYYVEYGYNGASGQTLDSNSNAYRLGCAQGTADAASGQWSEVVLAFGAQNSADTGNVLPITNNSVSYANVEQYAENVAEGYYACTGSDTTTVLSLAMGTNNSVPSRVTSAYGAKWAAVVLAVANWTAGNNVHTQVSIRGGNDIEPAWSSQSEAISWANGYDGAAGAKLYVDFGSCDGCPVSATTGNGYTFGPCSGCSTWNQYGIWEVAWGEPLAMPAPEIYVPNQEDQWAAIADYGLKAKSNMVMFQGPLDEYPRDHNTYTAAQAWTAFTGALSGDFGGAVNQTPGYSLEIHGTSS
jgi:hypothetical protein